jgi:type I restriction enzyme R subunit
MISFHIDQVNLDKEFDLLAEQEGLTDEEKETVAGKLSNVATLLGNPARIRSVCQDILDHFYSTVDPLGMKAQIVVYNRALCVAYFEQLTQLLAERGSADEAVVVMSGQGKDDPSAWAAHQMSEAQEEAALNRFRAYGDPMKFVVVTSKLGTGFKGLLSVWLTPTL